MSTPVRTVPTEAPASANPSLTPTGRQWWRSNAKWVLIGVGLVLLAGLSILGAGGQLAATPQRFGPDSPAPDGTKALVQTLAAHGVATTITEDLADVESLAPGATILVYDRFETLDEDGWAHLLSLEGVDRLVVVATSYDARLAVAPFATVAGFTTGAPDDAPLPAGDGCPAPLAANAPELSPISGIEFAPVGDAVGCWQSRDGYAAVLDDRGRVAVGDLGFLTNAAITEHANAAAAINLLGGSDRFVWYEPALFASGADDPTYGSYIPQWLLPATLLALAALAAAMLWRGRRFGPLVAERLPVVVPANETLEGRARLYDQADARLRALDAVRLGTIGRLAELLGLDRSTPAPDIVRATAAVARVPREHAQRVLLDADPATARELVDLANACAELERRVRAATGRVERRRAAASEPPASEPPSPTTRTSPMRRTPHE